MMSNESIERQSIREESIATQPITAQSIGALIRREVQPAVWEWLETTAARVKEEQGSAELNKAFAFIPRKTGTGKLSSSFAYSPGPTGSAPGIYPRDWTIDRLCRVWLLLQIDPANALAAADPAQVAPAKSTAEEAYLAKIEILFTAASMNESVALYSALPLLALPAEWIARCAEGIRSNIGTVLEAIMYDNDYPSRFLGEAAWNQLILKAFFTEKDTGRIIGIDQRANRPLANVLFDYAHERRAAGREVNVRLWRLTGPFLDAGNFGDIEKLFQSGSAAEKRAALLACSKSDYPPAQLLLDGQPAVKKEILEGQLRWDNLEETP